MRETEKEYVAVIAGNRTEFNREMHHIAALSGEKEFTASMFGDWEIGSKRYFYLHDMKQVRGLRRFTILPLGTWINRKDLDFKELEYLRDASWVS